MACSRDVGLTSTSEGLRLVAHAAMSSQEERERRLGEACWALARAIEGDWVDGQVTGPGDAAGQRPMADSSSEEREAN